MSGFNWVDLTILITLGVFVVEAYGRSLLAEILDFLSFLLAFFLSFVFYNLPANFYQLQFSIPHALSLVLGFITVWFLSETVFFLTVRIASPLILKFRFHLPFEKFLAIIPALLRGLIFIALFLVLIATFPIQPVIKKQVQDSKLGSLILKNAYALESPVKNVFGEAGQESLTFLTVKPKTNERVNLGFQTSVFQPDGNTENSMIELVNKERTSRGLNALSFDTKLRDTGRVHSADMFTRGYFAHISPEGKNVADRAAKFNVLYTVLGENLAYAPSLELAHKGLMNSPGHKANILSSDYNKIGVGVMDGGIYGLMFTQVFSD